MLSPRVNTIAAFLFAAFIAGWIAVRVIDSSIAVAERKASVGGDLYGSLRFVPIAEAIVRSVRWQSGEFTADQTLERDYERTR